MALIPMTPLMKMFREKSGLNISQDAAELIYKYINDLVNETVEELAFEAKEICELAGTKTLKKKYLEYVINNFFGGLEESE